MARLPASAHRDLPWRIHEIAPDFAIEDVWSFRAPGARADDFGAMVAAIRAAGGPGSSSRTTRALFALRWKLGGLFGWDRADRGLGGRVRSLRDRLPEDLRGTVDGEPAGVFTPLYRLPNELASELANGTVHTVMHLGWAPVDDGWELRMAVLVRPNGWFGRAYMRAILPFRLLVVYPSMTRQWERAWRERLTADGGRVDARVDARVPAAIRALGRADIDAVDSVTVRTTVRADPETWATVLLDDIAGAAGQWIWRQVLRLRLDDVGAPDTIAGWPVAARGDGWVRLEAESASLAGELVVCVDGEEVTLATFVRYRRPLGQLLWLLVLPTHRRSTAEMVREAPALVRARTAAPGH